MDDALLFICKSWFVSCHWPSSRFSRMFLHSTSQAFDVESRSCSLIDRRSCSLLDFRLVVIVNGDTYQRRARVSSEKTVIRIRRALRCRSCRHSTWFAALRHLAAREQRSLFIVRSNTRMHRTQNPLGWVSCSLMFPRVSNQRNMTARTAVWTFQH